MIDNHMYADSSWSDSPGEELVDFGDDRFVDNELGDADASVLWVPKTGDSSDSDLGTLRRVHHEEAQYALQGPQ